jgi:hypothetical protein
VNGSFLQDKLTEHPPNVIFAPRDEMMREDGAQVHGDDRVE